LEGPSWERGLFIINPIGGLKFLLYSSPIKRQLPLGKLPFKFRGKVPWEGTFLRAFYLVPQRFKLLGSLIKGTFKG